MTKQEIREQLREEISHIICEHCPAISDCQDVLLCDAEEALDQILKLIEDKCYYKAERELPKYIKTWSVDQFYREDVDNPKIQDVYRPITPEDMLKPDSEGRAFRAVYVEEN